VSNKKYPRSSAIQNAEKKGKVAYVNYKGETGPDVEALAKFSEAVSEFKGISGKRKTTGRFNQDLSDLATNVSGRPGLSKRDYYAFRPEEAPSKMYHGMMADADCAYGSVGLVRNIIDLMADFGTQGIRIVHPNKKVEKFFQNWFARVNGEERSERFLNYLYRMGNVVIRKQTARVNVKQKQSLFKAVAEPETLITTTKQNKNEIPWSYTFLNPLYVDVIGGSLASFVGDPVYAIHLPRSLAQQIKAPKTAEAKALVAKLPSEIVLAAKHNKPVVLPQDKTRVFYYKKDDWRAWASPMIHAIMDDIMMLEKLRLADMAALDGAISNIRIFKLGSLDHQIMPTAVAASALAEILENNVGGGTMDLVWGPDIELIESKTSVHQFLGDAKYIPHLTAIYAGLGIPPTLTGTLARSGTTNNLVSLKTLLGRLEYGRNILTQFWNKEIVEVQQAMGFRFPAKIEFGFTQLGDEAAEKALLIQLADRNLISDELIQHLFGNDHQLERIRINRENRERDDGKLVAKSGPFHDPQFGLALKKVALQGGSVTPGQVGLKEDAKVRQMKMFKKNKGEKPALEMRQAGKPISNAKKGQPQQGRPKNSKDKQKRKEKRFVPRTKAVLEIWARGTQLAIAEVLNPFLLDKFCRKNMRSLNKEQTAKAEKIKFGVLCNLDPLGVVDEETIMKSLSNNISLPIYNTYIDWVEQISNDLNRQLTLDETKCVQISAYVSHIGDE
jgi:hypothetical protein